MVCSLQYFLVLIVLPTTVCWLSTDVAQWAVNLFENDEHNRSKIVFRGTDRRTSTPFITGDGFRSYCKHVCEDANRCRMDPGAVQDGECVFVKTDFFQFFVKEVISRIPSRYIIVSHNGDLSAPDGQDDAPRIGMPKYITTDILNEEYRKGRLIAHHGQNLWWQNNTHQPRPIFSHCLPIGFENRQYPVGKHVAVYSAALKKYILNKIPLSKEEMEKKPLILVAFYPKSRVPDRHKVLQILGVFPSKGQPKPLNPFYNYTDLNHEEWLEGITLHKFVLAPFGHGLDTHRVSEILLMGGVPVMRRSTISSCYDDSDNILVDTNNMTVSIRGSLPVVILDSWYDLNQSRLEREWQRITAIPITTWDRKRLFIDHWVQRIFSQAKISTDLK